MGRRRGKRTNQLVVNESSVMSDAQEAGEDKRGGADGAKAAGGSILSPELMAQLGVENADSAIAPVKSKKKKRRRVDNETKALATTISKSKAKKMKQLEDKKLKDGRRAELYRKLNSNSLDHGQLSLLQSSKSISQNQDTARSRIKQAVQRAVAGMVVDNCAIAELESHPELVGDIEDLLGLPVGGALAAVRKAGGSSVVETSDENDVARARKGHKASNSKQADAIRRDVGIKVTGKAGNISGATGSSTKKLRIDTKTNTSRANAVTKNKRAKVAPPRVEVVAAKPGSDNSDSDSSTENRSSTGEEKCGILPIEVACAGANEPSRASGGDESQLGTQKESENKPLASQSLSELTDGTVEGVDSITSANVDSSTLAKASDNSVTTTSGASWADKMMSSLARFPTATRKSMLSTNASSSGATKSETHVDVGDVPLQGGICHMDEEGSDAQDTVETTEGGDATPASYPPPPDWVEGKAAAYIAVETPLPCVSGEAGEAKGDCDKNEGLKTKLPRPKRWVPVERSDELQVARIQLPVCGMEQEIVESIHDNDAVILCGETGSGKSTQVPQFLYEAGYAAHGLIGVTQPRRVAAVSTAERVAFELGTRCGREGAVAYQIRYDNKGVGPNTRVKFMTDGVLMQEITSDILLRKYSVVLLDEAHERNLNTDVLLGMLSRSLPLRRQLAYEEHRAWNMLGKESKRKAAKPTIRPLKLVIMSATLRVTDFTENTALFPTPPPVITASSRQHPVTVHFSKRTELYDYVGDTFKKVCKVHRQLPNGGILVFLTGKREIEHMCTKLRREFPPPKARKQMRQENRRDTGADRGRSDNVDALDGKTGLVDGGERVREEGLSAKGNRDNAIAGKGKTPQKTNRKRKPGEQRSDGGDGGPVAAEDGQAKRGRADGELDHSTVGSTLAPSSDPTPAPSAALKEKLLYREADDDEEDAALLAEIENENVDGDNVHGEGGGDDPDEGKASDEDRDTDALLPAARVVPLYAMLTAEEQAMVFKPLPEGQRLIVVATNVAETSITIPGVSYVVDCGREKRRVVQRSSGISKFEVGWISKASADQRAGRAGRTGPGHCYRLYSSALYTNTMEAFAPPEVLTRPLEDVMLQMKAMGVLDVSRFPFPTPPDPVGLRTAATLLANLGATTGRGDEGSSGVVGSTADARRVTGGEITTVGKALALLPVGARFAKMLLLAVQGSVLEHAVAMVSMLAEGDPFVRPDFAATKGDGGDDVDGAAGDREDTEGEQEQSGQGGRDGVSGEVGGMDAAEVRKRRAQWLHPSSDALARLKAAGAYSHATSDGTAVGGGEFCRENFLHVPTMERSLNLRHQLARLVKLRFGSEVAWKDCRTSGTLRPPSRRQTDALRQVLLSGLLDNVARRVPPGTVRAGTKLRRMYAYLSCNEAIKEPLYIKSSSVLFSRDPEELPQWVVYQDIVRGEREGAVASMSCVTAIEASWIPALAEGSPLLSFSAPLASPPPSYDPEKEMVMCRVTPRYGVHSWELPPFPMEMTAATPPNKQDMVFRWFGRLLLEGGVKGLFSELTKEGMLNDPPSLLTREMPTKKAALMILELRQKGVSSFPSLVQKWRGNPSYLKTSLRFWIKIDRRKAFEELWSSTIRVALQSSSSTSKDRHGG